MPCRSYLLTDWISARLFARNVVVPPRLARDLEISTRRRKRIQRRSPALNHVIGESIEGGPIARGPLYRVFIIRLSSCGRLKFTKAALSREREMPITGYQITFPTCARYRVFGAGPLNNHARSIGWPLTRCFAQTGFLLRSNRRPEHAGRI